MMRRNILRLIASFMVAIFGFIFVACGDNSNNDNTTKRAEFKMRGQSEVVLTEGYESTQTSSFKFDGVGPYDYVSVEMEENFNRKLSWDDDDQTLNIKEGLIKGEYSTLLTATLTTSKGEKEVEFPFTVKVVLPEIPSGSPKIAGEGFKQAYADYVAFSTTRFSLYGTDVSVQVSNVKKDGENFETEAFVWDSVERRLNVGAGLGVGVYTVTLTASSTDTQYEAYDFIYSFVVQGVLTPIISGPKELTIGEGYVSGTLSGFMLIGTDCVPSIKMLDASGEQVQGIVSFDKVNDTLEFATGLGKGVYTVTITLSNGDVTQDATHDVTVTVEEGKMLTGSFSYTSKGFDTDEVTGMAKDVNKNFYYPLEVNGDEFSASLIAGEYDLTLESKYFYETTKNISMSNANINVDKVTFTTPRLSGSATYGDNGITLIRNNSVYYSVQGATANEGFVVQYTMKIVASKTTPWVPGGFCFGIEDTWYSLLVYPHMQSSTTEASIRVQFTQGPNGDFVNGGYATMNKKVSSKTATIDVEIAFYDGAFYVCVSENGVDDEPCAVRIGAEFLEVKNCSKTCESLYFSQTNFNYCHDGATDYGKIDRDKFFGEYARVLGFRTIDSELMFTNVIYRLGNDDAKAAAVAMQAYAKTCDHSGAWAE